MSDVTRVPIVILTYMYYSTTAVVYSIQGVYSYGTVVGIPLASSAMNRSPPMKYDACIRLSEEC